MPNLVDLSRKLASGRQSSTELVEQALARIDDTAGQGDKAYLTVYGELSLAQAKHVDHARQKGWPLPRFAGIPISIKSAPAFSRVTMIFSVSFKFGKPAVTICRRL